MIRVMVVDDSALVRKVAAETLCEDPEITVTATASMAEFALQRLEQERPDVITLDLEMPGMGGLEAIGRIMALRPTPIVVLSAHAQKGAEATLRALELGAVDFVSKPSGGIHAVAGELREKVKDAARARSSRRPPTAALRSSRRLPPWGNRGVAAYDLIAIGTSTGGPVALKTVLDMLPGDLPVGIVVVQHMPPVFTRAYAERLDASCALEVREARDGDVVARGRVLIAPGNWHMAVSARGAAVTLSQSEAVNGHRPSVDVLMRSAAAECGTRALGVIMTGMGRDGAAGLHELRRRGGRVLAQDEASSVIYGMNREVVEAGDADEVAPLDAIAERICEWLGAGRTA